jgi:hypothetical protein
LVRSLDFNHLLTKPEGVRPGAAKIAGLRCNGVEALFEQSLSKVYVYVKTEKLGASINYFSQLFNTPLVGVDAGNTERQITHILAKLILISPYGDDNEL